MRPNSRSPDDQRFVQQAALLEVLDQGGDRLIGHARVERQLAIDVFVVIPRGVENVDEPHAALDQAAGEQAVGGESRDIGRGRRRA